MWGGIESILNNKQAGPDYYEILGCSEDSSTEQIITEYKVRALKLHPDKNPDHETLEEFQKIQEARDILTDPDKRKVYDQWRQCSMGLSFQQYKNLQSRCQMTMHWATPKLGSMLEGTGNGPPQSAVPPANEKHQVGDVRWGVQYDKWESDNRNRVYSKFRNYEI